MSETKEKKLEETLLPPICTFRGVRKIVMKRVWEKADQLEKEGKPLLVGDFGKLMGEEWERAKMEIPIVCQAQPVRLQDLEKPKLDYNKDIEDEINSLEDVLTDLKLKKDLAKTLKEKE